LSRAWSAAGSSFSATTLSSCLTVFALCSRRSTTVCVTCSLTRAGLSPSYQTERLDEHMVSCVIFTGDPKNAPELDDFDPLRQRPEPRAAGRSHRASGRSEREILILHWNGVASPRWAPAIRAAVHAALNTPATCTSPKPTRPHHPAETLRLQASIRTEKDIREHSGGMRA
jgi:hypothetical protein